MRILVINPGSTSTKIAVYENDREIFSENIAHSVEDLERFKKIVDQKGYRKDIILQVLKERGFKPGDFAAVVGRGGVLHPIPSGVYRVNDKMIRDLQEGVQGEHASNLGGLLADEIARPLGLPAFIADPVVVDELDDWARLTGIPEIPRRSIFHALNHKYTARLAAADLGKAYEDCRLIVCHMGGGITVGAHKHGRVVDVNNGLNGEGPITPERAGTMPAADLVDLVLSAKYDRATLRKMLAGQGGMVAHLGTNDMRDVVRRMDEGDAAARLVFEAMVMTTAKQVGQCAAVLKGRVDAVVLTGGLAHSREYGDRLREQVEFIAPVFIYPGENEMVALAEGVLRVLQGRETAKTYSVLPSTKTEFIRQIH